MTGRKGDIMILMIDNFDSFTYNLVQYFQQLGAEVEVRRNNALTPAEALAMRPEAIVLSPGPGRPEAAGIMPELIPQAVEAGIPLLGVCLGHQAIGEAFGASVVHAGRLMHGKTSVLEDVDQESVIFQGIHSPIQVARYHSLAVKEETLPDELKVTARSGDGEIMAMEHRTYPVYGLQFHPESVMTPEGHRMIENFIGRCAGFR